MIVIQQTVAAPAESQVAYSASELEWSSQPAPTPGADREPAEPDPSGPAMASLSYRPNRLIVKDAQLRLMVADTDLAIDRVTQVVDDCGAYIISSRVWYQDWMEESYKYASMTIGVPVDQFERAIRRLRDLAVQVVDETAAGQDVTDEYVDLQSRLGNLEATRDRIREFLIRYSDRILFGTDIADQVLKKAPGVTARRYHRCFEILETDKTVAAGFFPRRARI